MYLTLWQWQETKLTDRHKKGQGRFDTLPVHLVGIASVAVGSTKIRELFSHQLPPNTQTPSREMKKTTGKFLLDLF